MPAVSIVVPVYNTSAYLERCFESLARQTLEGCEIVIVDDGSSDTSPAIISHFAEGKPNVVTVTIPNSGTAVARMEGIRNSSGDFIGFVDSDDWVDPDFAELLYTTAIQTGADVVCCGLVLEKSTGSVIETVPEVTSPPEVIRAIMRRTFQDNMANKLFRRSLILDHGITLIPGWDSGEDRNFTLKFMAVAQRVSVVPRAMYHYDLKEEVDSVTRTKDPVRIKKYEQGYLLNYIDAVAFIAKHNPGFSAADLDLFKLESKMNYLYQDDINSFKTWEATFREANGRILSLPNHYVRDKRIGYLAYKRQWWLLKIYCAVKRGYKRVRK